MIEGMIRGHDAYWDGERWRYRDTDEAAEDWGGEVRPCFLCHEMPTAEGLDACIGRIEGATAACCGHGREPGYVLFGDGWRTTLPQRVPAMGDTG